MAGLFGGLFGSKKAGEGASQEAAHHLGLTSKPGQLKVLTAEELLAPPARKSVLNNIRSLISLPDKHYDALIGELFRNYAAFVQQLPATQRHHHALPGGLLDHSLEIALMSLLIRRGFMLPIGAPPEVLSKKQDIWSYATLSSALLKNAGVSLIQQNIGLYDAQGRRTGSWAPIKESLAKHLFYDVSFLTDAPTSLGARMTPLIAQMLMPKQGLLWLHEDRLVFNHWLAVLSWDVAGAGILGQMVDRANKENILKHTPAATGQMAPTAQQQQAQARIPIPAALLAPPTPTSTPTTPIEATPLDEEEAEKKTLEQPEGVPAGEEDASFDDIRSRLAALLGGMEEGASAEEGEHAPGQTSSQEEESLVSFTDTEPLLSDDSVQHTEGEGKERMQQSSIPSDVGEFFVQWARQGLASGHIAYNQEKSHIHHVKEGIFLVFPGIFQLFCDEHPELEMQPTTVQKRFQRLKLHLKKRDENICSYASYETGKRVVLRGYLIEDPKVLFDSEKIPPINTRLELDFI